MTLLLKELEKEEQTKPKVSRTQKIINQIEKKLSETQWGREPMKLKAVFWKVDKTEEILARLIQEKKKKKGLKTKS